ncbi:hypothetical protein BDB01DRAFT_793266 [Pilobolus umbonatus]|nr:hypothetical protein BDB01DRAFT_793266 [Pilobolus umbonatus]
MVFTVKPRKRSDIFIGFLLSRCLRLFGLVVCSGWLWLFGLVGSGCLVWLALVVWSGWLWLFGCLFFWSLVVLLYLF